MSPESPDSKPPELDISKFDFNKLLDQLVSSIMGGNDIVDNAVKGITVGTLIGMGLGALGISEYVKSEPVQFIYPIAMNQALYARFIQLGYKQLNLAEELKRINELWGVAKEIPPNQAYNAQTMLVAMGQLAEAKFEPMEVHVRAIQISSTQLNLSAHLDFSRKSLLHLKGLAVDQKVSYYMGALLVNPELLPGYTIINEKEGDKP
jgi:hypothetical protein